MLAFRKTADHPFLPRRAPFPRQGTYNLFTPVHIRLLPGQKAVVDFLLTVDLPPNHRVQWRLGKSPGRPQKLKLHAATLGERRSKIHLPNTREKTPFLVCRLVPPPPKPGGHVGKLRSGGDGPFESG